MKIRQLEERERPEALALVWETFLEFEAPDYSQQGIDKFKECLDDPDFVEKLTFYGAFQDSRLTGVLATRNGGTHVAMFFVPRDFQRRGIGRLLFEHVLKLCPGDSMTINSSPFAVPIYGRLGFTATDAEQTSDGIRFTPMTFRKNTN